MVLECLKNSKEARQSECCKKGREVGDVAREEGRLRLCKEL